MIDFTDDSLDSFPSPVKSVRTENRDVFNNLEFESEHRPNITLIDLESDEEAEETNPTPTSDSSTDDEEPEESLQEISSTTGKFVQIYFHCVVVAIIIVGW